MGRRFEGFPFRKLSCQLCLFEEGYSFEFFGWWIPLPIHSRELREYEPMEAWGFSYDSELRFLHLSWSPRSKIIDMPWSWEHVRCDVLCPDGTWEEMRDKWDESGPFDNREEQTFDYVYRLNSGEIQERKAIVYVERREWRWKWFQWLGWPRKVVKAIDVFFDGEVGERTGSWKGGTIGCGYEMLPGETARDTLLRMQFERKFE